MLGLPPVEGLLVHIEFSKDLGCVRTGLMLFQGEYDLLLGVSNRSQGAPPEGRTHIILDLVSGGCQLVVLNAMNLPDSVTTFYSKLSRRTIQCYFHNSRLK